MGVRGLLTMPNRTGEKPEVRDRARDVDRLGKGHRLALILTLKLGKGIEPSFDPVRHRIQEVGPCGHAQPRPRPERRLRCIYGSIHILTIRTWHRGDAFLRGRIPHIHRPPRAREDTLAADPVGDPPHGPLPA